MPAQVVDNPEGTWQDTGMAQTEQWTPQVGQGVSYSVGSDAYSATVIAMSKSGSQITLQDDISRVISGSAHDGSAKWASEPNPNGATRKATRRGNGIYRLVGWTSSGRVWEGRSHYQDPSF